MVFKPQPKKGNKFNAKSASYDGYTYHSKKEMKEAQDLDWRIKMKHKEVESWTRQHRLELRVLGVLICKYFIDFRAVCSDGYIEYIEVKGFETDVWRLKWKLTKVLFDELTIGENARLVLVTSKRETVLTSLK